jgi:hypothetical protein
MDNLYQIFKRFPLIRKYSNEGNNIWFKVYYNISSRLPHSSSVVTVQFTSFLQPENIDLEWLKDPKSLTTFTNSASLDIINQRILIDGYPHGQIYVLDYNGDIIGAYYPSDILDKDPDFLARSKIFSEEIEPMWILCYDSSMGRGYFTHRYMSLFYYGILDH